MRHLLLSTLLAFSVCTASADGAKNDAEALEAIPKCTAKHVPIVLKTSDGKTYTAFVKKEQTKKLLQAREIEAITWMASKHTKLMAL